MWLNKLMLTQRAKYALKALIILARRYPGEAVLAGEIAASGNFSKSLMQSVLLELARNGVLQSKAGKGGGYWLARKPSEVYLGPIIRTFDGALAPLPCASQRYYRRCEECQDELSCEIRNVMLSVRSRILGVLDELTLQDVITASSLNMTRVA